jgi:hypothetical protein
VTNHPRGNDRGIFTQVVEYVDSLPADHLHKEARISHVNVLAHVIGATLPAEATNPVLDWDNFAFNRAHAYYSGLRVFKRSVGME